MLPNNETSFKKKTPTTPKRRILKKGLHRFNLEGSSGSPAYTSVVEKGIKQFMQLTSVLFYVQQLYM